MLLKEEDGNLQLFLEDKLAAFDRLVRHRGSENY